MYHFSGRCTRRLPSVLYWTSNHDPRPPAFEKTPFCMDHFGRTMSASTSNLATPPMPPSLSCVSSPCLPSSSLGTRHTTDVSSRDFPPSIHPLSRSLRLPSQHRYDTRERVRYPSVQLQLSLHLTRSHGVVGEPRALPTSPYPLFFLRVPSFASSFVVSRAFLYTPSLSLNRAYCRSILVCFFHGL